jgi:hypothetical protein
VFALIFLRRPKQQPVEVIPRPQIDDIEEEESTLEIKSSAQVAAELEEEPMSFKEILFLKKVRLLWFMLFLSACKLCPCHYD